MSGTLVSPGVDVSIIDESFYGSAGPGTIPLIVIATAANKTAPSGTGIAPMTVPSTAGSLFLATSQRELLANYGNIAFTMVQGTPVNGDELNEYGLHAAYSYLGISNRAYILRADVDLSQLVPSSSAPSGPPLNGTYWLNLASTTWGLFQSNGNALPGAAWVLQTVNVVSSTQINTETFVPLSGYGANGAFAVVPWSANNLMFEKINGNWYQIGTSQWIAQNPTKALGTVSPAPLTTGQGITINGTTVTFTATDLATAVTTINTAMTNASVPVTASVSNGALLLTNTAGTNLTLANVGSGTSLATLGLSVGTIAGVTVYRNSDASWPSGSTQGSLWVKGNPANQGANWVVQDYNATNSQWLTLSAPFYPFNSALSDGNPAKDANAVTALGTPTTGTLYVGFDPSTGIQQLRYYSQSGWAQLQEVPLGSTWDALEYEADFDAPTTPPAAGTNWYNPTPAVDIMFGNGMQWLGYRRQYPLTDSTGPILDGSAPTQQVGGHTVVSDEDVTSTVYTLVDNDLWIDTSDLENYPMIYRWSTSASTWQLIDNTDHTTPFGIVFADARQDSGTTFTGISNAGAYNYGSTNPVDISLSDFVDPDAPAANAHPSGVLLFNTRVSTGNVKSWNPTYFKAGGFDPNTDYTVNTYQDGNPDVTFPPVTTAGRWVWASGLNATTLAPYMMRKAQRIMVVDAIAAVINDNQDIRSELVYFNIMASPGYTEALPEMHTLNLDMKEVSFIIADTPIRLTPDATSVQNWATNAADVASDGEDGLVTAYEYAAVYYPWGLGTDLSGNEVMIPPSTIALSTYAYNDQVAYPWFAPAGFQRGLVTNATSVGYLASNGTYQPVILNQGQRDTLYTNNVNPIAYIPGRGLVVYGQKTLSPTTSAMDRVNVARLVNYIAYNLDNIVKPYLFEPNDASTQIAAQNTVERFLNSLVGLQGVADYAVLCDSTNNTPDRVDLNQLWIDVAIVPIKAIEFIYIPVRIQNTSTGTISATS